MEDFNKLKPLQVTLAEDGTIVADWVEGQSFYVLTDQLFKTIVEEINAARTLREQIAREIEADKTPICFENAGYEIIKPAKEFAAHYAAIARGKKG